MTDKPENPPAFPTHPGHQNQNGDFFFGLDGMTLRDYFAIHSDQPGVSEIANIAGYKTDGIFLELPDGQVRFTEWWNALPLAERCALSARVRYAQADAMLAERERTK